VQSLLLALWVVVVEAVEVATLWVVEVAILVGAEEGEVEVVVEAAHLGGHQEAFLEAFQGGSPLEEVVIHPEIKGCLAQHQRYSMEAGKIFTALYSHSASIGR
jgi:hypothetical protein